MPMHNRHTRTHGGHSDVREAVRGCRSKRMRARGLIIIIHILTSIDGRKTYNSADLQACYLANIIYIVQLDS